MLADRIQPNATFH